MVIKCIKYVLVGLLVCNMAWAKISSRVQPSVIEQGEIFTYILDLSDTDLDTDDIDFSPLEKDFEILNRSHQSNNVLRNGTFSSSVQLILNLAPKRSGNLRIPSLNIEGEETAPHEVEVTKVNMPTASEGGIEAFSTLSTNSPKVQQAVVYSFTLLLGSRVDGSIVAPEIIKGKATIEALGEQQQYKQELKGKEVLVVEQRWLITPQQSGEVSISAARLVGKMPLQQNQNPFAPRSFRNQYKRISVAAEDYRLQVAEIPSQFSAEHWLAADAVTLTESWDVAIAQNTLQETVEVGQPITRTIKLQAKGAAKLQLRQPELPDVAGIKQYPDTAEQEQSFNDNQLSSELKFAVTLIPSRAGSFELPAVQLPWWNVEKNQQEMATLPAKKLKVIAVPSTASEGQNEENHENEESDKSEPESEQKIPAPEKLPALEASSKPRLKPALKDDVSNASILTAWLKQWPSYLIVFIFGLLSGSILTYVTVWIRRRSADTSADQYVGEKTPSTRQYLKALHKACKDNDAPAARLALQAWVKHATTSESISDFTAHSSRTTQQQIHKLDQFLYAKTADEHWQGRELFGAIYAESSVLTGTKQQNKKAKKQRHLLAPFYPSQTNSK